MGTFYFEYCCAVVLGSNHLGKYLPVCLFGRHFRIPVVADGGAAVWAAGGLPGILGQGAFYCPVTTPVFAAHLYGDSHHTFCKDPPNTMLSLALVPYCTQAAATCRKN